MDIALIKKASDAGAPMTLEYAGKPVTDESGKKVTITLAGPESDRWRDAQDKVVNKRLSKAKPDMPASAEDFRMEKAAQYAAVTISWENLELDGKPLDCNFENAQKLYYDHPWIAAQIDEFIGERKNFWKASSKS